MTEWLLFFALLFGMLCVAALGAIVARAVHTIERATRAVEQLAASTRAREQEVVLTTLPWASEPPPRDAASSGA